MIFYYLVFIGNVQIIMIEKYLRLDAGLIPCPVVPTTLLGRVGVDQANRSWAQVEASLAHHKIHSGGHHSPNCLSRDKGTTIYSFEKRNHINHIDIVFQMRRTLPLVAILVPFRDRESHLRIFLFNFHPFLIRQNLDYRCCSDENFESLKYYS